MTPDETRPKHLRRCQRRAKAAQTEAAKIARRQERHTVKKALKTIVRDK